MAPEQELGEIDSVDERTDVYGLGALLGFLLPADRAKPIQAVSDKAKSPNAEDRYSTVQELARDVNRFLNGDPVTAFPEGWWETGRRLARRHKTVIILIATYLAVRVVLLLVAR
jgi:hypothetical protein